MKYLLAIESSCDETAAAVIDHEFKVHSSVIASQEKLHEKFGGVVPEIASRAHLENMLPVIDEAIKQAGIKLDQLSCVAVAVEPGLVGSLLIGLTAAKTLAYCLEIPLIALDHVQAHLYACKMSHGQEVFPAIGLVVSGGHTNLYDCRSALEFKLLGSTIDDAAGEAFDKVAQILGLGFPGGPAIERAAKAGDARAFQLPRSFIHDSRLDFSFSGLKTAVLYAAKGQPGQKENVPELDQNRINDLAASFQSAVVDVLVEKSMQALKHTGYKSLLVGGGVAANSLLREELEIKTNKRKIKLVIAPREYCTDNAAMGAIGWELYNLGNFAPLEMDVTPGLVRIQRG
jgi:N6-L-threonylcarbamoyladenine synthase